MTKSIEAPTYTQIPNVIFDYWMPILSGPQFAVLLHICRKTFGWHQKEDAISLTQFEKATDLTRKTVIAALDALIEHGLVEKNKATSTNTYKIIITSGANTLPDSVTDTLPGSGANTLEVVEQIHTQKKHKETKKENMFVADEPSASKIIFLDGKTKKKTIIDDTTFYQHVVQKRVDWTPEEIDYSRNVLNDYQGVVYDWFSFIEGTVSKYRKAKVIKKASGETNTKGSKHQHKNRSFGSCKKNLPKKQKNINNSCSEKGSSERPFPNLVCLGDLIKQRKFSSGSRAPVTS